MFFFGSSTTYSISAFLGWNSTHLMVNPLNEQRCGVYPSCVDHFPTDTMAFPWLFHGFSTSLWVYPMVTPSCREVREESLGRRSHYRSHVTRRAASPANHPFLGETRWFFQHPETGKWWKMRILEKSYGKRWSNYTAPYLSIFSIRSIHFKAREIIQFSNLSDLRPYWNMAYDAQDGKYKNNAERRSGRSGAGRMMSFRRPRWKSARSDR